MQSIFFFTLRLLFSLKERTCARSLLTVFFFFYRCCRITKNFVHTRFIRLARAFQSQIHTLSLTNTYEWIGKTEIGFFSWECCYIYMMYFSLVHFWPAFSNMLLGLFFYLFCISFGFGLCIHMNVYVFFFVVFLLYHAWIKCFLNLFQCTLLIHGNKLLLKKKTQRLFFFTFYRRATNTFFFSSSYFCSFAVSLWWKKHKFINE